MPRSVRAEHNGLPIHERAGLNVADIVEELAESMVSAGQSPADSSLEGHCLTVYRGSVAAPSFDAQKRGRSVQRAIAEWLRPRKHT